MRLRPTRVELRGLSPLADTSTIAGTNGRQALETLDVALGSTFVSCISGAKAPGWTQLVEPDLACATALSNAESTSRGSLFALRFRKSGRIGLNWVGSWLLASLRMMMLRDSDPGERAVTVWPALLSSANQARYGSPRCPRRFEQRKHRKGEAEYVSLCTISCAHFPRFIRNQNQAGCDQIV